MEASGSQHQGLLHHLKLKALPPGLPPSTKNKINMERGFVAVSLDSCSGFSDYLGGGDASKQLILMFWCTQATLTPPPPPPPPPPKARGKVQKVCMTWALCCGGESATECLPFTSPLHSAVLSPTSLHSLPPPSLLLSPLFYPSLSSLARLTSHQGSSLARLTSHQGACDSAPLCTI